MNISKNKAYLIAFIFLALVIIVSSLVINNFKQIASPNEKSANTGDGTSTEYPNNLLEGIVIDINPKVFDSFVMEVDVSSIKSLGEEKKTNKTIKITDETKIVIYNLLTGEEEPINIKEFELGDNVVVATQESTYEDILTKEEFTAVKISKMVKLPTQTSQ